MKHTEIEAQLETALASGIFRDECEQLIKKWERDKASFKSQITGILRFVERHPNLDYGSPGDLVHFVEGYYRKGYEEILVESINRQPTPHTLWMLNRLINGARSRKERDRWLDAFRQSIEHPLASEDAKREAREFLSGQSEGTG